MPVLATAETYLQSMMEHPPLPIHANIEVSQRCNINCVHCARYGRSLAGQLSDMSMETFRRIEPVFPALERLYLFGHGEPLINPHFMDMLEAAKRAGPEVYVTTNGTRINAEVAEAVVELGLDRLNLSVDAASKGLFESIRQGAKYDQVIGAVEHLNRAKEKRSTTLPTVVFEFVGMKRNIHELADLVRLAARLHVDRVLVANLLEYPAVEGESLMRLADRGASFFREAVRLGRRYGVRIELPWFTLEGIPMDTDSKPAKVLGRLEAVARLSASFLGRRKIMRTMRQAPWRDPRRPAPPPREVFDHSNCRKDCRDPFQFIYIDANGYVRPCCITPEVMGNVNETDLLDIWHNNNFRVYRRFLLSEQPLEVCANCVNRGCYHPDELSGSLELDVAGVETFHTQLGHGWCLENEVVGGRRVRYFRDEGIAFVAHSEHIAIELYVARNLASGEILSIALDGRCSEYTDLPGGWRRFEMEAPPAQQEGILTVKILLRSKHSPTAPTRLEKVIGLRRVVPL